MEQAENPVIAEVILDLGIEKALDYHVPSLLGTQVRKGVHVKVPVRGRLCNGYIYALKKQSDFPRLLPIHSILSEEALITEELFELALWMSRYYGAPLRQVLKVMLPASVRQGIGAKEQYFVRMGQSKVSLRKACSTLRQSNPAQATILEALLGVSKGMLLTELLEKTGLSKSPIDSLVKKGFLQLDRIRLDRSPLIGEDYFRTSPKQLNSEQKEALDALLLSLKKGEYATHLLYGITGSGKTEIYLQAIAAALEKGQGTILLVPEISLTTQTIERFRSRFDSAIAVLHHRLSKGERYDEWNRIRAGKAQIVIGARSAIFSPVRNLGLIIVDEEHEGAYKQSEEAPCYHARDVAVMRGRMTQSVVLLGSATPSLESYRNALTGKYHLNTLLGRIDSAQLPRVTLIDMKREYERAKGYTLFSESLVEGIKKRVEKGEQTILFLNRRGYHTSLQCRGCGQIFSCPHCDLALTFHRGENILSCHLCDHRLSPPPSTCPHCRKNETLKYKGTGTEQVERALHALLPEIRILRIDGDTTKHKGSHDRLFHAFRTGKSDVLVGTQMIAKGLHFPTVTLVAILNSDGALHIPDFRASERAFQMITQVSGRAGRGELPGEVIIQTQMPDNTTIQLGAKQDYQSFYTHEREGRELFGYPPFSHLVKCLVTGKDPHLTFDFGNQLRNQMISRLGSGYAIHPLIPSGHPKIKDQYRFQFLIRGPSPYPITTHLQKVRAALTLPKGVRLLIDVDPLHTF